MVTDTIEITRYHSRPSQKKAVDYSKDFKFQKKYQKKFYSPQFTEMATVSVKRISWAVGKPMSTIVHFMVQLMPMIFKPEKVCKACKDDSKCEKCCFSLKTFTPDLDMFKNII